MLTADPARTAVLILDRWHRAAVEYAVTRLGEVATVDELVTALGQH